MADYWIKLYHEILDDPKMATMPDRLWRRTIEIFLMAGRLSKERSGILPDTRQLAWMLRMDSDELQGDLDQLTMTGIIHPIPNGWQVTNFQNRQAAVSSSERVRQHRERKQKREYYEDVTPLKRNVTQILDTDIDTDTDAPAQQNSDEEKPGGAYAAFERAWVEELRLPLFMGGPENWYRSFKTLTDAGATPDDFRLAIRRQMSSKKQYTVTSPASFVTATLNVVAQRNAKPVEENPNARKLAQLAARGIRNGTGAQP